jgi:FtsP/CotA-like multicopper oxidase with cupredoxin domain
VVIKGGVNLSNKGIIALTIVALIVMEFAGMIWYKNHKLMTQNANMEMAQNSNLTNNMDMQSGMNMSGNMDMNSNMNMNDQPTKSENNDPITQLSNHEYAKNLVIPKAGQPIKKFTLTAKESSLKINADTNITVWTYNDTVPGEEIRVTQGDFVQVELKNELKDPVTIHWHGYPLISGMDGVPGVNQDAVRPGETFTYEFSADVPGTYWYHSHQEGSKQVDKGLYGALIVEPKNYKKAFKDYTLILDEWMSNPSEMESMEGMNNSDSKAQMDMGNMSMDENMDMTNSSKKSDDKSMTDSSKGNTSSGMAGMDMSGSGSTSMSEEEKMAYMYDIYTVNGKSGDSIEPIKVKKGDIVILRFINAGYRSHGIHIPGKDIKIVSTDGQDINGAGIIKDQIIMVAPGERYDVEFKIDSQDNFVINAHDDNAYNDQIKIPVNVEDGSEKVLEEDATVEFQVFDLSSYGTPAKGKFTLEQNYDIDYNVVLNTRMDSQVQKYTINGKTFDELPPLEIKSGNKVKFTFENKSTMDHPMHLHGHFFQILSKNGKVVSGAPIMKDTLLVGPGEKYIVAFEANNPGNWVQHCHELHHAAGGMMQEIKYIDFEPNYKPDLNNKFNNPE